MFSKTRLISKPLRLYVWCVPGENQHDEESDDVDGNEDKNVDDNHDDAVDGNDEDYDNGEEREFEAKF